MKTLNLVKKLNLRNLALVGIFAIALFAVSCDKANDDYVPNVSEDIELKSGKAVQKGELSIAETAINAGFDSLVVALQYVDTELDAGLVDLFLYGTDQYTVFAPTNEAFVGLVGNGKISDLPAPVVLDVLLYHVTDGRRAANSVLPKKEGQIKKIETLNGQTFQVDYTGKINTASGGSASILTTTPGATYNISASNGIIHVVDSVLLPEL